MSDSNTAFTEEYIGKISKFAKNELDMLTRIGEIVKVSQRKGPDVYFYKQRNKLPNEWIEYWRSIPIDFSKFTEPQITSCHDKSKKKKVSRVQYTEESLPDTFLDIDT